MNIFLKLVKLSYFTLSFLIEAWIWSKTVIKKMSEIRTNILEWIVLYGITINFVFSLVRAERRNMGPTGQHVVHLSTMRHLFNESARAAIFVYWSAKKNTDLVEDVEILLFVTFRWIPFSVIRREIENVSEIRHRGGHFAFPIGPKTKTW